MAEADIDFQLLYPSAYLKSEDIHAAGKTLTLRIQRVRTEDLEGADGSKKTKVVISFSDSEKKWVAPVTCGLALKVMWGPKVRNWIGKRVTLFVKRVDSFGEEVDAIRVMGSPDITQKMHEVIPRGRKKIVVDVVPTGKAPPAGATSPATAPSEPLPPMSPEDADAFDRIVVSIRELGAELGFEDAKMEGGIKMLKTLEQAKKWFADLEQRVVAKNEAKKE